ncbi:MAG: hypothetical protein C0510_08280 [Erythrobacter sp.]|nr:hypothetical protein [Erythrobacter sp.]
MRRIFAGLSIFIGLAATSSATADDGECYDVKVWARPVSQVPSVLSQSDDPNVIIMAWPWFIDLEVKRVLEGDLSEKKVTVLAVLHTSYVSKARTWLLRKNSAGSFNLIRSAKPSKVPRCKADSEPMRPYIRPSEGRTLEDYRREGEEELKRYDDDTE